MQWKKRRKKTHDYHPNAALIMASLPNPQVAARIENDTSEGSGPATIRDL